ncbi:hypothetical protein [Oceanobacillus massiliensis]|nr:hypothetical protein [Oceanobacillus massiliensis]
MADVHKKNADVHIWHPTLVPDFLITIRITPANHPVSIKILKPLSYAIV